MFIVRCCEKENGPMCGMGNQQVMQSPCVMECPQERVCHIQTLHNVSHVVPINTGVINHHIYRHTYQPMYTCTMEDEVSNVCDCNPCGF